jgi:serine/threonine protein kinase
MITKDELRVKIIDFGSCKDMEGTEFEKKFEEERKKFRVQKPSYKNFVGTPNYMAPECVRNKNSDFASDCWSLGCLLYNLFTGFPPFLGKSDYLIFLKSTEANYKFPPDLIPPLAEDLISKLIVVEPSSRLTIPEIFNHPYLKDSRESLSFPRYPYFELKEYAYKSILNKFKSAYEKYKDITEKFEKIKRIDSMIEDSKRNEIQLEENKEDQNLLEQKETISKDYNTGIDNLHKDINNILKNLESTPGNEKLFNKFTNLEKQMKHEFFKIDYENSSIN